MVHDFVSDANLLWLKVPKIGTPPAWIPGYDYQLGDVVIPRFPVLGQEEIMFQVVGFIGSTGTTEPPFPSSSGGTVEDSGVIWTAISKDGNPPQLPPSEYFVITESVTAS